MKFNYFENGCECRTYHFSKFALAPSWCCSSLSVPLSYMYQKENGKKFHRDFLFALTSSITEEPLNTKFFFFKNKATVTYVMRKKPVHKQCTKK